MFVLFGNNPNTVVENSLKQWPESVIFMRRMRLNMQKVSLIFLLDLQLT